MAWGKQPDAPDGYRPAKDGETPDMTLNGNQYVHANSNDDGVFDAGEVGDKHYHDTFDRNEGAAKKRNAARSLLDAESGSLNKNGQAPSSIGKNLGDSILGQRQQEESGFQNNVIGKSTKIAKSAAKGDIKGLIKKGGPVGIIIAMLLLFGGGSMLGQAAMPFSLISQFQGNFDSIGTSNQLRSRRMLQIQMDDGNVKDCRKSTIFGKEKFKVTSRQKKKLAKAGITLDKVNGVTVMKYDDIDGVTHTVTAADFDNVYETDTKFHDAYYEGSRTWRGAVSDWFDDLSGKFLDWLGVHRNNFINFKKTNDPDADADNYKSTVEKTADSDGVKGKANHSEITEDTETDENGDTKTSYGKDESSSDFDLSRADVDVDADGKVKDTSKLANKVQGFVDGYAAKATGIATGIANGACGVLDVTGALGLIAAAYQTAQIVKTASILFEGIQKGQVEPSNISPLNEIANSLTQKAPNTYYKDKDTQGDTTHKSAMEANAVGALYGNIKTDTKDPSVKSFNILSSITGFLGVGVSSFKACTYTKLAAAAVDTVMGAVEVAACVLSLGIGCIASAIKDAAISVGVSVGLGLIVQAVVPVLAKVVTRKIATEVMGEDLGNALVSGANIYMGSNHQFGGGSVANKSSFAKYISERDAVVADRARYERNTLSPFDTSSQYTFMGALLTSLVPLSTQMGSISSTLTTFGNTVSQSFSKIMPGASAVSAGITAQEAADNTAENCLYLDSIGAVGDAFCNPYFISDSSTIEDHPADTVNKVAELGGFENDEEEEVPTIKEDSNLAKYIVYCGQRQSPFGMPDQNIASAITSGTSTGNMVGDSIVGAVPVVGDFIGILENTDTIANYGYISGEACVVGNNGDGMSVPDWDETKQYQRFVEDQRLAENMGLTEKSAVTAFLDKYYEEHPLDNSYEGILARRSGLTKENVVALLDYAEDLVFLANYNPTNYYPLHTDEPSVKNTKRARISNKKVINNFAIATIQSSFDKSYRQRNYAV